MKSKMFITWAGAMIMAISMFNPGMAGSFVFFVGMVLSTIFVVIPFVAMIVNPIVERILNTKLMNSFGGLGKSIFRFLFHIPTIKVGKRN